MDPTNSIYGISIERGKVHVEIAKQFVLSISFYNLGQENWCTWFAELVGHSLDTHPSH